MTLRRRCSCHREPLAKDGRGRLVCGVKKRARQARYNRSEKGRARHARYNATEASRQRWWRYEDGAVRLERLFLQGNRRRIQADERDRMRIAELGGDVGFAPIEPYVPDYNGARRRQAMLDRVYALGWDWIERREAGMLGISLGPVREDAVPRRVIDEVMALYRITPADNFTRRKRRVRAPQS